MAKNKAVGPKAKMTEEELKSIFEWESNNSIGRHDGDLSDQRRMAVEYYYGNSIGNEIEGRSQVVSHDVFEVVEWAMPHIMKVFTGSDRIAEFEPTGPEDEAEAEQATDYVNYLFEKRNGGFSIIHDMAKDALLEKTGVSKIWWDDTPTIEREEYSGLDDFAFAKLVSDEEIEVVEHTETEETVIGPDQMPQIMRSHDAVVERVKDNGRIRIEVIPPEELLVSKRAKSLDEADFVGHKVRLTISEVKDMFPDVSDDELDEISGDEDHEWNDESNARHEFDDSYTSRDGAFNNQISNRKIWITEGYMNVDWDGDGYAELRKITKAGSIILENIPIDDKPFASICPIPVPHKYYGLSLSDKVVDIQIVKSTLIRNILDNIYNLNNGRFTMLEGQANLDDLLTSRPGGVIRVKTPNAVTRLDTPPLPSGSFELLNYVDQIRDGRTGVSKFRTGIDPNVLNNAKAGPANAQMDAANARLELMVRIFSETGIKDMFKKMYGLILKHQDRADVIKLKNKWVQVDPTQWKGNANVSVNVGLGHGNRDQAINHMAMLAQNYVAIRQDPEFRHMVSPKNVYNMVGEALKSMGYKNFDRFISNPDTTQPQPPQPDPKAEADKMKAQIEMQKMQMEGQKMQAEMQMDKERQGLEQMRMQVDMSKDQQKNQIEVAKLQSQLQAEREQNQIEMQKSQVEIEKIRFEKEKLMAEMQMEAAEHALKVEELEVEREQARAVKVGD